MNRRGSSSKKWIWIAIGAIALIVLGGRLIALIPAGGIIVLSLLALVGVGVAIGLFLQTAPTWIRAPSAWLVDRPHGTGLVAGYLACASAVSLYFWWNDLEQAEEVRLSREQAAAQLAIQKSDREEEVRQSALEKEAEAERQEKAHEKAVVDAKRVSRAFQENPRRYKEMLKIVRSQLKTKQITMARSNLEALEGEFESVRLSGQSVPSEMSGFMDKITAQRKAIDEFEAKVFDRIFEVFWDPKNATKDEDKLTEKVARQFKMRRQEVTDIYLRHDDEAEARLVRRESKKKAKAEADRGALIATCGEDPGSLAWAYAYSYTVMTMGLHDPDSLKLDRCWDPVLDAKKCWVLTCNWRAKNAFGAMVLHKVRYYFRHGDTVGHDAVIW